MFSPRNNNELIITDGGGGEVGILPNLVYIRLHKMVGLPVLFRQN